MFVFPVYDIVEGIDEFRIGLGAYHDWRTVAARLAPVGPWVEIGAGGGQLRDEIVRLGGRCVATDAHVWSWFSDEDGTPSLWDRSATIRADAERVGRLVGRHPSIGLISAWPSYDEDWCYRAVRHLAPGQLFAYVGEGPGGCTGDDSLHDLLDSDFDVQDLVEIERAEGMHDRLYVYRRKT